MALQITDLVQHTKAPNDPKARGHITSFENHKGHIWAHVQWLDGQQGFLPQTLLKRIEVRQDGRAAN